MPKDIPFYPPKSSQQKSPLKSEKTEKDVLITQIQKQTSPENYLWTTLQIIGSLLVLLFFLWLLFGGLFEKNNSEEFKSKGIKYLDDQEIYEMQTEQIQEDNSYKFGTPH